MTKKQYKTLWELHREDTNPLNQKYDFKEVFPQIKGLYIEVLERGEKPLGSSADSPDVYDQTSVREYLDCHNPKCKLGGFKIGDLIHKMANGKTTFMEENRKCSGHTAPPRGHRTYPKSCRNTFQIKIQIEYIPDHFDSTEGT